MKPDTKEYILCDSIQMKFKKKDKINFCDRNQNNGSLREDFED